MSRFTLAAVAEMMDYRNPTSYESPVHLPAVNPDEPLEAQGIVDWMLQSERQRTACKSKSRRSRS